MIASTATVVLLTLTGSAVVVAGLAMGLTRRREEPGTRMGLPSGKNLGNNNLGKR